MRSICVSTSSNNIMATRMSDLDVNLDLTDNDSTGIEVEEEDEHSEAHSSRDDEPGPSKKAKTSKFKGAAIYKSKFQKSWTEKWPYIVDVTGNPHQFKCTICNRQLSCAHMGISDVQRHIEKDIHVKNAKSARSQSSLNFVSVSSVTPLSDQVGYAQL